MVAIGAIIIAVVGLFLFWLLERQDRLVREQVAAQNAQREALQAARDAVWQIEHPGVPSPPTPESLMVARP